jgi:hypothetical protein
VIGKLLELESTKLPFPLRRMIVVLENPLDVPERFRVEVPARILKGCKKMAANNNFAEFKN